MELLTKKVEFEVTLYDFYDNERVLAFDTRIAAAKFINKREDKWITWQLVKITTTVNKEVLKKYIGN